MTRTDDELHEAAGHLGYEWQMLADLAGALASIRGARTLEGNAQPEASLLHYRCLVNFLSGDFLGRRDNREIQPRDFLGREWWLADEEYDRRIRGRLPVVNRRLAHLSWARVDDDSPVLWKMSFLAREVSWGLGEFVTALGDEHGRAAQRLRMAAQEALTSLPADSGRNPQTELKPAPPRQEYREGEVSAAVRRDPQAAMETLRDLGYTVEAPEG